MTRWKLFSYLSIDHKAAQADLNTMAADGWRLRNIYGGLFARFTRTDRADFTYFVDLADPQYKEDPDYLALCADAGWNEVCAPRYMRVYESRPGCTPAPIQTDGGVEYERFLHISFRRMLITLGVAVLVLFLYGLLFSLATRGALLKVLILTLTQSFMGNLLYFTAAPLFLGIMAYFLCILLRIRAWNAIRTSGDPIPIPRFAHLRGMLTVLGSLYFFLLFFSMSLDLGMNRNIPMAGYFVGLLAAIPLILWLKEHRPRRRVRPYGGNPVLYIFLCALLLRLLLPAGTALPFTLKPVPIPAPLTIQTAGMEEQASWWLSAEEQWYGTLTGREDMNFSARRFTLRTPALAELVGQTCREPYMEPVPGMDNTWWTPDGKPQWSISELVFLRENTVWYFYFYTTTLTPDLPALLNSIITGQEAAA